jgi:hypothetical protein
MKINTIRPMYVESFPTAQEDGILYISRRFSTACHLCCCGCGTKIITPLRTTEYRLTDTGGRVTLYPSIGNWNHRCRSHYVIRNGQVLQAGSMGQAQIDAGRAHDEAEKRAYYNQPTESFLTYVWNWIRRTFQ